MSRRGARAAVVLGALAVLALPASAASAHPLGNFTTNAYAGLVVAPERVTVDYVVDLAEVPALRLAQQLDAEAGGRERYPDEECSRLAAGLDLRVAGAPAALAVEAADLTFLPGEAGLDTARLECRLAASTDVAGAVTLADANHAGRVGWREITATGEGMTLVSSDVPEVSLSDRLQAYPEDRLASPLDVRSAALEVRDGPGGGLGGLGGAGGAGLGAALVPGPVGRGLDRYSTAFTDLVARQDLTTGVGLAGVLLAVGLGGLHAVAPGHGKTVMAAVLVGRDGSGRQALALGLTVAVAHTLGVLALGAVFTVIDVVSPDRVFAWLGVVSGLLFAVVGLTLLRAALARRGHGADHDHGHHHGPDHDHGHSGHDHPGHAHDHAGQDHPGHDHPGGGHGRAVPTGGVRWRQLIAPGLAGGLVPSPSALLVLLGGLALGRGWFGLLLVVAYGLGMAAVLVGAGYALLRARGRILDRLSAGSVARVTTALPVATAGLVVVAGLTIALRAATTAL